MEKTGTQILTSILRYHGPMHYEKVWQMLVDISYDAENYFADLPTISMYSFFERYPLLFNISVDGYITSPVNRDDILIAIDDIEEKVALLLWSHMKRFECLYYVKLAKSLNSLCNNIRVFSRKYSLSEKFWYFRDSYGLNIQNNGYAYAVDGSSKNKDAGDNHFSETADSTSYGESNCSSSYTSSFNGQYSSINDSDRLVDDVINFLTLQLEESNSMHYRALLKTLEFAPPDLSDYFTTYSDSQKYWFFRNHMDVFSVQKSGYVSLVEDSEEDDSSDYSNDEFDCDEDLLIRFFREELVDGPVHYRKLVLHLEETDLQIQNHFENYSSSEQFWFFRQHEGFYIGNDGYVSVV